MSNKKYWILNCILAVVAVLIHFFSAAPLRVEHYYSTAIYPPVSIALRYLLGWMPFSLGDIGYGLAALYLLLKIVKAVKRLFSKAPRRPPAPRLQQLLVACLSVYIIFNVFWGINYNRAGIAGQLGLSMEKYSVAELKTLNDLLLQKINASKTALLGQPQVIMASRDMFGRSAAAYAMAARQYPFLNYQPSSIKKSMWGWLGNYTGFLGYYNPFTGESQVNTTVPGFLQPFICCHEMAHQLGYAKENEANFVGYLAAAASTDESFHYSVYLDLFLYANRNLFLTDSVAAKASATALLPAVKQDIREWRKFDLSHQNPVEPLVRWAYGKYLQSNQQPSGELTYDEVTGFMIAYYNKFGKL